VSPSIPAIQIFANFSFYFSIKNDSASYRKRKCYPKITNWIIGLVVSFSLWVGEVMHLIPWYAPFYYFLKKMWN